MSAALLKSFVPVQPDSHFPIQNLPYGIFSTSNDPTPRPGVAIGDEILDLRAVKRAGLMNGPCLSTSTCFENTTLNSFMSLGKPAWQEARSTITRLLSADEPLLRDNTALRSEALIHQSSATMHLPATIGDYTDFFCSKEHACNCGVMFRGADNALHPNWLHLPVGYHGRASSIIPSGTPVRRPWGQIAADTFQPCAVVDFELEMGCFIGPGNELGSRISASEAENHMFGFVLVNDWSARDIQKWESVPLGPFNAKNWATSISPWIVTLDALEAFSVAPPLEQDPPVLPYLQVPRRRNYNIQLEASISPASGGPASTITRSNMQTLYWTLPQMIAHHTAGGCNLRPGDLIATGTLSTAAPEKGQGCMLELSWSGTRKVVLDASGEERTFLVDGDAVTLTGYCQGDGYRVGFGECTGKLLPAHNSSLT